MSCRSRCKTVLYICQITESDENARIGYKYVPSYKTHIFSPVEWKQIEQPKPPTSRLWARYVCTIQLTLVTWYQVWCQVNRTRRILNWIKKFWYFFPPSSIVHCVGDFSHLLALILWPNFQTRISICSNRPSICTSRRDFYVWSIWSGMPFAEGPKPFSLRFKALLDILIHSGHVPANRSYSRFWRANVPFIFPLHCSLLLLLSVEWMWPRWTRILLGLGRSWHQPGVLPVDSEAIWLM